MKSSLTILTRALIPLLLAGSAHAAANSTMPDNWYLGLSGDITWMRNSDTGGGGNVELGYHLNRDFRLEGEVGYHDADGHDGYGEEHYYTYMGNLLYDFNGAFSSNSSGWRVVPYVGGGIGDAQIHNGDGVSSASRNNNSFAYQGMAGLTLVSSAAPNTDWSLGYRYQGTDTDDPHANNVELGVRVHF